MTPERWQRLKNVIESALEREPAARGAFLLEACGQDATLRAEAESFVAAHDDDPSFLEDSAEGLWKAIAARGGKTPLPIEPGRALGAYQVVRPIASGGMGAVYLAVRADDAYRKQVAIKVIRTDSLGDSRHRDELQRRFRTERQTLANLDHSNIARLLDGGATDDGLPFLVMEYIEGRSIDQFCDDQRLSTTDRLELFSKVCQAVSYAHRSLVIHRDLKPSNILVTADGEPKLLDFGLAKLLDPDSSALAATLTRTGLQPLTPAYASPEQIRGEPVTTSTDVYSLGVILFELLTGHRPYRGSTVAMHDLARLICEQEPDRPSQAVTRVEKTDDHHPAVTPESISQTRDGRPERLRRRLAGDIDTIVLKALRKEPARRYASVEQFAEDIRRHLRGEPILARPGTWTYHTTKFVRRHRAGVIAAALVLLSLSGGLAVAFWQLREAQRQTLIAQHQTEEARRQARVKGKTIDHWKHLFRPDRLSDEFAMDAGVNWSRRGDMKGATLDSFITAGIESIPQIKDDPLTEAEMREQMASICADVHRFEDARSLHEQAWKIRQRELGNDDATTLESMANVGFALMMLNNWKEARPLLTEAVEVGGRVWGPTNTNTLAAMMNLGVAESNLGEGRKAETHFRKVLEEYRAQFGEENEPTLRVMNLLGKLLADRGAFDEARTMLERTIAISKDYPQRGADHQATLEVINNLAGLYYRENKLAEATDLFREVFEGCQRALDNDDPLTLKVGNNLAHCLIKLDRLQEAETILDFVVGQADIVLSKDDFDVALFRGNYGECLTKLGHCRDAQGHLDASYKVVANKVGPSHPATQKAILRLAEYHEKCGSAEQARDYRALLEPAPAMAGK
ncbi:MAG TPA: serine/threonine-protein kinase [Phycisphaerae bacterium]|nr:serine/threonine-protein kinase [Phycisphaerae bacterium]